MPTTYDDGNNGALPLTPIWRGIGVEAPSSPPSLGRMVRIFRVVRVFPARFCRVTPEVRVSSFTPVSICMASQLCQTKLTYIFLTGGVNLSAVAGGTPSALVVTQWSGTGAAYVHGYCIKHINRQASPKEHK